MKIKRLRVLLSTINSRKAILGSSLAPVRSLKRRACSASKTCRINRHPSLFPVQPGTALRRAMQATAVALQDQTDEFGRPLILHAIRAVTCCPTAKERVAVLLEFARHQSTPEFKGFYQDDEPIPLADTIWISISASVDNDIAFAFLIKRP